jgi:TATA-box binding protein (TBP) (component of TFIID and TFIIIB)
MAQQLMEGRGRWQDGGYRTLHCCLDLTTFPAIRLKLQLMDDDYEEEEELMTCTALIFATGRVIVTGVRTLPTLTASLNMVQALAAQFPSPNQME